MAKRNREKIYGDFEYVLPVQPPKKDILFSDLPKKKQKWNRTPLPEDFDNWDVVKQKEYVDTEFERMDNGIWIMLNGSPYYITGKHYFFLQWWVLEDGTYPDFRDADRRLFYMWDISEKDEKALGLLYMKFRRRGSSSVASSICAFIGISEMFQKLGIISKTGDDARMIFSQMVVNGVYNLPNFLKPTFAGSDKPVKEFIFADPAKKTSKAKDKNSVHKATKGLNTIISWKNTALNSYDGQRLRFIFVDEVAKWAAEVPFDKYYEVVKTCLTKLGKKVGIAYITSTVGEVDNDKTSSGNKKAGDSFKVVWEKSNPNKLYNGRTASGLIRYFSPAYDGYKMDEYGFSLIEESKFELEEIRRSYIENNDIQGLNEHIRQFPFTEEEALSSMSGQCLFDEERIRAQENFIKLQPRPIMNFYDLVWEEYGKKVRAVPNPNGRFEIFRMPKNPNAYDIVRGASGRQRPLMQHEYIAGADPFSSSDFKDKRDASDGSITILNKYNEADPENSAVVDLFYLHRPKTVNELHEDYLKSVVFYSCELNTETTPATVVDWFIEQGYEHYLKETPEAVIPKSDRNKRMSMTGKNKYGVSGQNKFAGNRMNELAQLFMDSFTEHIFSLRLLEQCRRFDPNNRTAYDGFMSFGYALLAMNDRPKKKENKEPIKVIKTYAINLNQ